MTDELAGLLVGVLISGLLFLVFAGSLDNMVRSDAARECAALGYFDAGKNVVPCSEPVARSQALARGLGVSDD